ncbi:MAG: 2-C-methyl-D-erythritol 4-phosphate cytidylyltransferase [Verrucomicrobiales bacterium]
MTISAIIVAAGSSRRMGFDKLEADLRGETVLARSMMVLQACPEVDEIRVVTGAEKIASVRAIAARLGLSKFVEALEGGSERHLSVHAGLDRVGGGFGLVAVHDAARPLATPEAIGRCAAAASEFGAASLAHRVTDTLKRANAAGEVRETVSRDDLWAMETPQIFESGLLRRAYETLLAHDKTVTDEVSAVEAIGHPVKLVENTEPNLKITVPADLALAEAILAARER